MDTSVVLSPGETCVACGRADLHFVRTVASRRTGSTLNLYFCDACESFAMPSSYDQGSTPERALEFHKGILERNLGWSEDLFERMEVAGLPYQGVVEIGCGSGATLHVAKRLGAEWAIGYDLNKLLVDYAAKRLDVEVRGELWDRNARHERADLLICLSVIEHLNDPTELVGDLAAYCAKHSSLLATSVPLHGPERHREAFVPNRRDSAFRAGDSHVMYYSPKGFQALLRRFNARLIVASPVRGWVIHFAAFDEAGASRLRAARPHLVARAGKAPKRAKAARARPSP